MLSTGLLCIWTHLHTHTNTLFKAGKWGKRRVWEIEKGVEANGRRGVQRRSDQFLGLKEALKVLHLPEASEEEEGLCNRLPKHMLVCALTGLTETLLAILKQAFLSQCSPIMLKSVQSVQLLRISILSIFWEQIKTVIRKLQQCSILLFSFNNTHDKTILETCEL